MKIDDLIQEELKDPEFSAAYRDEGELLDTAMALYYAREEAGLTQEELAEQASTTQATIARIERGDNVSFAKYAQIAHALGKRLKVTFE
ncbi:helix-turn-helix domain-containing protein [Levilactobacillus yiduensis]|uniref:helix-turn-helix domain-containing protein n=1 Tax=Levilactobacillus yiduensis TaxID=2953880 RepID=UPI000EF344EF|nr:helix-turn-helix transcriptional regulator [Levilactobacillus yiduensis]AYM01999.1 XRE family transcriptional regulator [Levilactobacillus brevis]